MAENLTENPAGVDKKIAEQRIRKQQGIFVRVDEKTRIFVRQGRDPRKVIEAYKNKLKNREYRW